MAYELLTSAFWILSTGFLGLCLSGLFADRMKLPRRIFLVPYVVTMSVFFMIFLYLNSLDFLNHLQQNWLFGTIAGLVVGVLLARNVMSKEGQSRTMSKDLIVDIFWLGLAYGITDALILNVLPVIVVSNAFNQLGLGSSFFELMLIGITALGASLLVTLLYHLGYPEFRNKTIGLVLIGNTLITLAYLLSMNPLGAILSHTMMHVASTIKGPETTIQLPPHYVEASPISI